MRSSPRAIVVRRGVEVYDNRKYQHECMRVSFSYHSHPLKPMHLLSLLTLLQQKAGENELARPILPP